MVKSLIDRPDLVRVTYRVLSDSIIDPERKAKSIALSQTTDIWAPTGKTAAARLDKFRGVVVGIDERQHVEGEPYEYFLTVGFPPGNTDGSIPSLLTMIFGKVSLEGRVRVESIGFPESFLRNKGPKHGVAGIRALVQEPTNPLLLATLKPSVGLSPAELAAVYTELAAGGAHLVKDEETLPDTGFCPAEKRLEACLDAAAKVRQATGQTSVYAINLTGRPTDLVEKARRLQSLGAACFVFNTLAYGFGVLEELRSVGVPIIAQPALAGALAGGAETGISYSVVLGSLMRLAGADVVLFPSNFGGAALPSHDLNAIRQALTRPQGKLFPAFPSPMGTIHPGLLPRLMQDFGADLVISTDGAAAQHPQGPRAGARAFRQAIQWIAKRGNLGGVSEEQHPELAAALKLWGRS